MAHTHAKIKHGEKILKLRPDTVTVSSSAIVFKFGKQTGNIYLLTSGLGNSDKKIHKMAPNGWHLSISRILNGFPWLENTILHFLRLLIKVHYARFWEHNFQLPRFFASLRTSLPTAKKVPFCAFHDIAWNRKKGTFFCALKHRLVKREMDEERTILTSKYHSLESWKYLTSFSKKVPFLNF